MTKNSIMLTGLIFTLLTHIGFSQNSFKKNSKKFKQAEKAFEIDDYLRAYNLYQENLKFDSTDSRALFKSGLCLFNINKNDTLATINFIKIKDRIPESHFFLGRTYQLKGDNENALQELYYFKTVNQETSISNTEVEDYIRKSETAIKKENEKEFYVVKNVGPNVNTENSEYVPLIWNLNGSLIFTSRRENTKFNTVNPYGKYFEDIYISQKTETGWALPKLLGDSLNTATHDACVSFSSDGTELIIYRTDEKKTGGDLYISSYDNQCWSSPKKLGSEINSEYLETSACFSSYGNEIIFSSNRPGGFGGRDLYRVVKFMNGNYSLPLNLGTDINTKEDEDAPYLDKNDNSLYFSSRGHNSMGEYDIFKAEYNSNTARWSNVQNMGPPVNSTNDDIYFVKLDSTNIGYFASRRAGGYGDADIYQVNFSESSKVIVYCKLNTNGIEMNKLTDLNISLFNLKTGKLEGSYKCNKEYKHIIILATKNDPYELRVESTLVNSLIKNYSFDEKNKEITIELNSKL